MSSAARRAAPWRILTDKMASVTRLVLGVLLTVVAVQCRESIFADLSNAEIEAVQRYLEDQNDLQIISHRLAKVKDSYVFLMEAYRPNKTEALDFLDNGQDAPERAARVVIHRGDTDPPQVQEYRVWPLPSPAHHAPLTYSTWKHPIPFHARSPFNGPEETLVEALVVREFTHIEDIIDRATDGYRFTANCTGKCLRYFPAMPAASKPGDHQLTGYFVRDLEGGYLFPIGLQFVLLINSIDEADWDIGTVWFRGQRFNSFRDMGQSLTSDQYTPIADPAGAGRPTLSSSMHFRGDPRPTEKKRGPVTYMPDGDRFEVAEGGRRIKWMGWEFEFGMLASSGIQLFDVNFLKERIIYELALQELSVFYSGGSPIPSHTNYYDSVLIFGLMTAEMFPGIDCPTHAQFFNFTHYMNGVPHVFPNGACIFEMDRGVPLRKHYETDFKSEAGYRYAQGMPDNVLVFRHMLTVLNYDYMIDVVFHQAGQVEVKLSLTGYVLTTFYTGHEMDKYGHRINSETAIGNVHHHTANFKVDMDIKGTKNRFETLDIKLEDVEDSLTEGETLKNRYVVKSLKRTEEEAAYKFNFDNPKYLIVYNEEEKNKYGDHRGYRLLNDGMSKMMLPDDYRGVRGRAWTKYQVAVTKFKEDERTSSSIYTATEPFDPVMSFDDYITDEGIVDEDLVLWVTMGTHHIPHTEDVPVVNSPGVQLTFYLLPYQYFNEDPSLASRDNIRVVPDDKNGGHNYKYSGVDPPPVGNSGNDKPQASCVTSSESGATRGATLSGLVLVLVAAVCLRGVL